MKHAPADIIRHYMKAIGICTLPEDNLDWPGYVDFLTGKSPNAILFTDTNGRRDGRFMRTGETIEHPGLQVLVRSNDQQVAWQRADLISKIFDATAKQIVTIQNTSDPTAQNYVISSISRRGSIIPLSTEEHYKALERQSKEIKLGQFIYVLNALITLESEIAYRMLPKA